MAPVCALSMWIFRPCRQPGTGHHWCGCAPLAPYDGKIHPHFTAKTAPSALKTLDGREQTGNIVLNGETKGLIPEYYHHIHRLSTGLCAE